ncbi:MAG: tetratricopeptide repeat protein, partial [Caldisericia bacterium]
AKRNSDKFPDGICFVNLSDISEKIQLVQSISTFLNLQGDAEKSPTELIIEHISDKKILLILDSCELVAPVLAKISERFLENCPNLRIITTTTESLEISGEEVWRIPSLEIPQSSSIGCEDIDSFSAVKLFVERSKSASSSFDVSEENLDAAVSIVKRLDGLPLAIELAAARTRILSPLQINQKLNQRFKLLTKGSRDAADRQKTLRKTIDWSYDLLTDDEKTLLNRIGVFSDGFSLESATAVATGNFDFNLDDPVLKELIEKDIDEFDDEFSEFDEFEILDLLDGLHSKSLIVTGKTSKGETRYHLLNTIREYAKEKLTDLDELDVIKKRHLMWFTTWTNSNRINLRGKDQALWMTRFESENQNILEAVNFGLEKDLNELQIALTSSSCIFWNIMGYHRLALEKTKQAIERINVKSKTTGSLCLNSGVFAHWLGDFDEAIRVTNKSIEILEEIDAQDSLLFSYQNLAIYYQGNGNIDKSFELYEKTIKLSTELKQFHMLATSQMNLGMSYFDIGRYDDALRELKTSLTSFDKVSDYRMICWTNRLISSIHVDRLDLKEAELYLSESMKYGKKSEVNLEIIQTLKHMAQFYVLVGKYDEAIKCNGQIKVFSKKQLQELGIDYYYDSSIEIYMSMNDMEKTKYYLEKRGYLRDDWKFLFREDDIRILLTLAKYFIFNRELDKAKQIFDKIEMKEKSSNKIIFYQQAYVI